MIHENERHLYVPYKEVPDEEAEGGFKYETAVSWDAQIEHGWKLFRDGHSVFIHRHGWNGRCTGVSGPFGGCRVIALTGDQEEPKLVPVIEEDTESESVLESQTK